MILIEEYNNFALLSLFGFGGCTSCDVEKETNKIPLTLRDTIHNIQSLSFLNNTMYSIDDHPGMFQWRNS
jgi:hypothetical protein